MTFSGHATPSRPDRETARHCALCGQETQQGDRPRGREARSADGTRLYTRVRRDKDWLAKAHGCFLDTQFCCFGLQRASPLCGLSSAGACPWPGQHPRRRAEHPPSRCYPASRLRVASDKGGPHFAEQRSIACSRGGRGRHWLLGSGSSEKQACLQHTPRRRFTSSSPGAARIQNKVSSQQMVL